VTLVLWLLPAAIFAIGIVPMLAALRTLREETSALRGAIEATGPLRFAYVQTRDDLDALRRAVTRHATAR
jgi:hypothetical protein